MKKESDLVFVRRREVVKMLLMMKILSVFCFAFVFNAQASLYAQNGQITLSLKNTQLSEVFKLIQQQSDYRFLYSNELLKTASPVSIHIDSQDIGEVMSVCLRDSKLDFEIKEHIVLIKERQAMRSSSPQVAVRKVKGRVLEAKSGTPMPGVTIVAMKNGATVTGVASSVDGNFEMNLAEDIGELTISFIGYKTQKVKIESGKELLIRLEEEVTGLDEVVVIGYGTEKKKNISGSVVNISSDELSKTSAESFQKAMQGKMAGVQITSASGTPGGAISVIVRGRGTISAGTDPLYIIDGVQVTTGDQSSGILNSTDVLSTLNPDEIESIDILKDGASASIYGAQAANGVVIITTKKGREGKTTVSVKASGGLQQIVRTVPILDGPEFAEFTLLEAKNLYGAESENYINMLNRYRGYGWGDNGYSDAPTTDWYKEIYQTAYVVDCQAGVSGGSEKTRFYLSAAYNNTDGIIKHTGFERGSFRVNLSHDIAPWLTFSTNNSYSIMSQAQTTTVASANPARTAMLIQPTNSPRDENGEYYENLLHGYYQHNVAQMLELNEYTGNTNNLISANDFNLKLFKGLSFKSSYNFDILNIDEHLFIDPRTREGKKENGKVMSSSVKVVNFQTEQVFTYSEVFNDIHRVNAVAGFSYRAQQRKMHDATATGVANPDLHLLGTAAVPKAVSETFSEWKMAGMFARVNYSYKDRYIITGTLRRDGSSRFGEENRWGLFPSVSAAWRITEEPFMADVKWISDLKFRASYGITGNSNIGNYVARRWYSGGGAYDSKPAIIPSTIGNLHLTWEKNHSKNIGLTMGFLDGRISADIDLYINDTKDLLYSRRIPSTTGFTMIPSNMGGVRNMGMDFMLNTVNIKSERFEWNTSFNFSLNRNEVTSLQDGLDEVGEYKVGEPVSSERTYRWAGVNAADGRPMYYDKDGYITYNPTLEDRVWVGTKDPKFYGGFNNDFKWKGLTLSLFFQFQKGAVSYWSDKTVLIDYAGDTNLWQEVYDNYWKQPGDVTWVPKPSVGGAYPGSPRQHNDVSTLIFEKTDYLKLKNISLSYDFPRSVTKFLHLSSLQVYGSVYNVWTTTTYPGYDPEFIGNDRGIYPQSRSYTVGVKFDF